MHELPETIAVDVVFLPPGPIMDIAIGANRTLLAGNPDGGIRLDREGCLPHISVAMFPAKRRDITDIAAKIEQITRRCSPMSLTIDAVAKHRKNAGETVSTFHILKAEILQLFHKTVMNEVKPYQAPPAGPSMFSGEASAPSVDCLLRFPKTSAYERYSPHITLGFGDLPEIIPGIDFPVRFEVTKAALCHLGSHCTCHRVLATFDLGLRAHGGRGGTAARR
ncbi:2'-5' RNA ligase family protein [Methanoculleus sp. FWC-SCC3]|uniref:2'-5' RNA ligase family protein n=1 Tax=Methanoculleus methanifontis TaxID=2584086 RepID=A0ABT8M0Q2_9EURY|nr:2'-5' RNA ligase family protein [Methanoculleus sp. FWC-SCC3]MDN7012597.1 2'-5' RNA ligase family protein [Methanoculleus sp. FWC-SCC3]